MNTRIPLITRNGKIARHNEMIRENALGRPNVRMSQTMRRVAVVGLYLFLSALFGTSFFRELPGPLLIVPLMFYFVISYSVGGIGMWTGRDNLDERERSVDDHATAVAYKVVAAVMLLVIFYLGVVYYAKAGMPLPTTTPAWLNVVFPLLYLVITLPKAILAWTLPNPVREPKT